MSQDSMMKWSATLSSEELHAKVVQASRSMASYLADGEAAAKEGAAGPNNDKVLRVFAAAGYSPEKAKAGLAEMKAFPTEREEVRWPSRWSRSSRAAPAAPSDHIVAPAPATAQGDAALVATLAPDGVVLWPRPSLFAQGTGAGTGAQWLDLDPHDAWKASRLAHVTVVGNADLIVAQLAVVTDKHVREGADLDVTVQVEITEVLARTAQWRAVAMAGGELRDLRTDEPVGSFRGHRGRSGRGAARSEARGRGAPRRRRRRRPDRARRRPDAREVLGRAPAMTILGAPREVRTPTWGLARAYLDARTPSGPRRVVGQVVATFEGPQWRVISVHYLAL